MLAFKTPYLYDVVVMRKQLNGKYHHVATTAYALPYAMAKWKANTHKRDNLSIEFVKVIRNGTKPK